MNQHILVIEDNEQNRYLVTFLLEKRGYAVLQAGDGPSGIEIARCEQPDLILLDIQLPVLHGYAVVQELQRNQGLSSVPIVAVTSFAMVGDHESILEAGCNGHIEKPINPETFVEEVERYLWEG